MSYWENKTVEELVKSASDRLDPDCNGATNRLRWFGNELAALFGAILVVSFAAAIASSSGG